MDIPNVIRRLIPVLALLVPASALAQPLEQRPTPTDELYQPERVRALPEDRPQHRPFARHFVVYQASRADDMSFTLPLNNASNMLSAYGNDNVAIEIVAFGPGIKMMTKNSPVVDRVESLAKQGIQFSACANTMKAMGIPKSELAQGVATVTSGVVRINELHEGGWTYIRP